MQPPLARETVVPFDLSGIAQYPVPITIQMIGTTRKYLIPLLEYFDSRGHTVRRGERRYLVERAAEDGA